MGNKLALSDDILMRVEKPARYIGNERNATIKDLSSVKIRFAMCFPDVYEIGMSNIGIQILYEMMNRRPDVYCERVYSPWPDLDKIMRDENIPLFSLETQSPIKDFDFLGITLQYEMCYSNILQILDLSGIALRSSDRNEDDPIVMAGGACTYNPEPVAAFFDLIYIGEGETSFDPLFDIYNKMKEDGTYSRVAYLRKASKVPGIYVPSLYDVTYNEDGTVKSFEPKYEDVPKTIRKQVITDLSNGPYPTKPIIPYIQVTQDRAVLEIQRGCIRGCRFCQAGMTYRPNREKDIETLKKQAIEILDNTGFDEISLSSLSSSDYEKLPEFLDFLIEECEKRHVNISLPSLRIDAFSLSVMSKVQDVKKSSITFAPEAGSQRLRDVINKGLTVEDIMNGSRQAFLGGWNKVKFYFMLGLPTETDEDVKAIPELSDSVAMLYYDTIPKEERHGRCNINISTSFFVPKPFTPFQWAGMFPPEEYLRKAHLLKDTMRAQLNQKSLSYQYHEADVTILEGVFARGDRKLSDAIEYAYKHGALFDAWSEFFSYERWLDAFEKCNISIPFYAYRERTVEEKLPWDFIDIGVSRRFLENEWKKATEERGITNNCRDKCSGCGCATYGGGVCFKERGVD